MKTVSEFIKMQKNRPKLEECCVQGYRGLHSGHCLIELWVKQGYLLKPGLKIDYRNKALLFSTTRQLY